MKIAVVGTGVMGKNHVRVLKSMAEVSEVVISDTDVDCLQQVSSIYGIDKWYLDYRKLIKKEKPDGIIIATPPQTHKSIAAYTAASNIHVLVEKPIAHTLKDAYEMIEESKKRDLIFTIGHTERYNPILTTIKELIDSKFLNNIYLINTHRVGPFPKRLLGNTGGVLIDLAVHDFDIIHYLGESKFKNIISQTIPLKKQEIYVRSLITLENGVRASSEFSWISPRRIRTIEIYGDSGMIFGDYFNQEVWFYENSDFELEKNKGNSFISNGMINTGAVIKYPIFKQEPLFMEISAFINNIKGIESSLVTPEEATLALEYAQKIK